MMRCIIGRLVPPLFPKTHSVFGNPKNQARLAMNTSTAIENKDVFKYSEGVLNEIRNTITELKEL